MKTFMCCFLDNHKRMQSQSFNSCGRKSRPSSQHQDLSIREKDEKKYKNYKNVCIQPQMIVCVLKTKLVNAKAEFGAGWDFSFSTITVGA